MEVKGPSSQRSPHPSFLCNFFALTLSSHQQEKPGCREHRVKPLLPQPQQPPGREQVSRGGVVMVLLTQPAHLALLQAPWQSLSLTHLSCCASCWGENWKAEREALSLPPDIQGLSKVQRWWRETVLHSWRYSGSSTYLALTDMYFIFMFSGMAHRAYSMPVPLLEGGRQPVSVRYRVRTTTI